MTRLRPRTARAIADYPSAPVVYRRPFMRAFFAVFYAGAAVFVVWMLAAPPDLASDRLTAQDWWVPAVLFVVLGGAYLYGCARLVVDATHVRIYNPLRRADIPLAHVTTVIPGRNLRIETGYAGFFAWGVEAGNVQLVRDDFGTQGDLVDLIRRAAHAASNGTDPPARYRFWMPNALFWIVALTYVAVTAYIVIAL